MAKDAKSSTSNKKGKEDKISLVEERQTKPPGTSRFIRKKLEDAVATTQVFSPVALDGDALLLTDADFCQNLLVGGYVQSYVDFYHLTHRVDPNIGEGSANAKIVMTIEDMLFVRDNLVSAEVSRRQGNTAGVYSAYTTLADYYVSKCDWRTAIYFHEKCLEVAKLTADSRAEMCALHASGEVCQKMGDYESALKFHVRHEEQARLFDVIEEVKRANIELYRVYMVLAERLDNSGKYDDALELYFKCLESSKKCWDKAAEGEADGKIGALLLHQGKAAESVPYLRMHSQISADMGSAEGRCRACSALAIALDSLGQAEKALGELKMVQTISEQAGDVILQAQASRALGTLFSKVGNFEAAVDSFSRHFSLLKSILLARNSVAANKANGGAGGVGGAADYGAATAAAVVTSTDLDMARVYVGISKGNLLMGEYVTAIQCNLTALLDWKLNRTYLSPPQESGDSQGQGNNNNNNNNANNNNSNSGEALKDGGRTVDHNRAHQQHHHHHGSS